MCVLFICVSVFFTTIRVCSELLKQQQLAQLAAVQATLEARAAATRVKKESKRGKKAQ